MKLWIYIPALLLGIIYGQSLQAQITTSNSSSSSKNTRVQVAPIKTSNPAVANKDFGYNKKSLSKRDRKRLRRLNKKRNRRNKSNVKMYKGPQPTTMPTRGKGQVRPRAKNPENENLPIFQPKNNSGINSKKVINSGTGINSNTPIVKNTASKSKPSLIRELTSSSFDSTIKTKNKIVLVEFGAPWCGPCRQMKPILESTANRFNNDLIVAEINCDNEVALADKYRAQRLPTLIFFKAGKEVSRHEGTIAEDQLESILRSLF